MHWIAVFVCSIVVVGCSSSAEKLQQQLQQGEAQAERQVQQLAQHIDAGHIRHAALLQQYAQYIQTQRPDMAQIAQVLAADATTDGPIFQGLKSRLQQAKQDALTVKSQGEPAMRELLQEQETIALAATPELYNMMLTDPVNVLADMSNGQLGRVESLSKEASLQANGAQDFGTGSQLIGNPNYGQWQQSSNGDSFWEFYGKYALLANLLGGDLFGGRRIDYGTWAGRRNYSYYADVGRQYYSSPRQVLQQNQTFERAQRKFQSSGQSFNSPYAKAKRGASAQAERTANQLKPRSSKFNSAYAKPSAGASNRSSSNRPAYNSRSRTTSRSFGGGGK